MKLRDTYCPVNEKCPEIEKVEGGFELVGKYRPDPKLPDDERRIFQPDSMHPHLADMVITNPFAWRRERRDTDWLRIQTLQTYDADSDDEDFVGYVNGAAAPASPDREPFFHQLRDEWAQGLLWRNLLIFNGAPTQYQRYANEWVYRYSATNAAETSPGQIVRVLDVEEHPAAGVLLRLGDFWVVEHQYVTKVRYDERGGWQGEVAVDDNAAGAFVAAAAFAWELATPFARWYAEHPEYLRQRSRAA